MENYLIAMAVSAGIYALMALGVNVMWGFAGMVNLGLVGFFAVGAVLVAILVGVVPNETVHVHGLACFWRL